MLAHITAKIVKILFWDNLQCSSSDIHNYTKRGCWAINIFCVNRAINYFNRAL